MDNTKRKDNDPAAAFLRHIANFVAGLLVRTGVTPNQVTVFNFILFVPLILYFFLQGTYQGRLIALGLIIVDAVLDLVDGALARMKSISSPFGAWLDSSLDVIFQNALFIAIVVSVYHASGNNVIGIAGLMMIFGQGMAHYMGLCYDKEFGFDVYSGSKSFNPKFSSVEKKRLSSLDLYLKNIIVPSSIFYIFFFTCRYLLILGILFNLMDLFIICFAVTINIRWITMWLLYLKFLAKTESKLFTIKFLNELYIEKRA